MRSNRSVRPPPLRLPVTVLLLGVTSFFADVGSEMIFPLLPVFMVGSLGATPAFLGLVEGVADATASVLKLATGYVVEASAITVGLFTGWLWRTRGPATALLIGALLSIVAAVSLVYWNDRRQRRPHRET